MRGLPQVAIALLAAGAAVSGCGGGGDTGGSGSPEAASPQAQLTAYLAAFNRGDGQAACALLTDQAKAGVPHLSDRIKAPDCEGAIRELSRRGEHIRSPKISVSVDGRRAVARIRDRRPPYQSDVPLQEQHGEWRIAYPPALLERFKAPPGIPSDLK